MVNRIDTSDSEVTCITEQQSYGTGDISSISVPE